MIIFWKWKFNLRGNYILEGYKNMEKAKVYFSDLRALPGTNLPGKLKKLIRKAGIGEIDFEKKMTAIKIHFGEPGNLSYLRPNWAKAVADVVKELGGRPFLTDCNTLYVGRRKDALEHIESAYENGFTPFSTGCQVIIADGLKGTDETYVPVEGGELVKDAKIGTAIMDADVFISLNHFKGHEATGFGGALKNIGMGCGSRAGKMDMHSQGKPVVNEEKCIGCHRCEKICAHSAPTFNGKKCHIDLDKCVGCGRCIGICPVDAISEGVSNSNEILNCRMMEYALAVTKDRPCFHIAIAIDISPNCDCHAENDAAITPNVGMFASFDPVALDQACADAVNAMPANAKSALSEAKEHTGDHFNDVHPDTSWKQGLEYAEKIGLGTRDYNLIVVK